MQRAKKVKNRAIIGPGILSLQTKLIILFSFVILVLLFAAAYTWYNLNLISSSTEVITHKEIPLTRGLNGSLVAILDGKTSLEAALLVDAFSKIEEVEAQKEKLNRSAAVFDAYLAAITWGSETEAFLRSNEGRNSKEWSALQLEDLKIQRPAKEQVQFAGTTGIYFGGFTNNALRAIESHSKMLRLQAEGSAEAAAQAEGMTRAYKSAALRFSALAIDGLSQIVKISNTSVVKSANDIEEIQVNTRRNLLVMFVLGFIISLYGSWLFIRRDIIGPIVSLTQVAQKIGKGNLAVRAKIKNKDEIGVLAKVFNNMADRLAAYPAELERTVQTRTSALRTLNKKLQSINATLEGRNKELDRVAKALVRRDLELSETRRKQEDQLKDLDRIAKALVSKDRDLLKTNDELREIDTAKSQFVSIAAHQLRTPLSVIKWTFRMLLSGDFGALDKGQIKILQRGYETNESMISLVSDLLDVARIESGRLRYDFKNVSIRDVINSAVKENVLKAQEKNITVTVKRASKESVPLVRADEGKIKMVIHNLLSNAIEYTLPRGKVEIQYQKEGDTVEVRVKDTGVGVSAQQQHRLFTKFFRGDNVIRMQTQGTGLGLYIAANIIAAHKGKIGFNSKEGKGSTFWFSLPINSTKHD